jgi:preprotein translocase subunit YajC
MELLPLVLLLGIMYFLLIRPQQQRVRAQRALVTSIQVGDRVATIGGILGRVLTLDDEEATVETTPGTILRIRRGAIATRLDEATTVATTDDGPLVDEG